MLKRILTNKQNQMEFLWVLCDEDGKCYHPKGINYRTIFDKQSILSRDAVSQCIKTLGHADAVFSDNSATYHEAEISGKTDKHKATIIAFRVKNPEVLVESGWVEDTVENMTEKPLERMTMITYVPTDSDGDESEEEDGAITLGDDTSSDENSFDSDEVESTAGEEGGEEEEEKDEDESGGEEPPAKVAKIQ